ncbi:hypothetical protein WR25_24268 [Diploscapter pachys]|uniref:Uncharacterized protein n=1 Tax=Diploscapter pachys TaxID=2018661 RepID=A0A2A2M5N5_9BILA|nr:hypothetical protein WR25_24268 [Diploscapter pachys]
MTMPWARNCSSYCCARPPKVSEFSCFTTASAAMRCRPATARYCVTVECRLRPSPRAAAGSTAFRSTSAIIARSWWLMVCKVFSVATTWETNTSVHTPSSRPGAIPTYR